MTNKTGKHFPHTSFYSWHTFESMATLLFLIAFPHLLYLCTVEFCVKRTKISRKFNHSAFWNKCNNYQNSTGMFFCLYREERSLGIQNQAALSNVWLSVYWFIWDCFCYVFPKYLCLFFCPLAFLPHCHKRFQTGLCLFRSPLSHLPTGHISQLFEDKWM